MKRFITAENLSEFAFEKAEFSLPEDISHHVLCVMRYGAGDEFELMDASGCRLKVEVGHDLRTLFVREVLENTGSIRGRRLHLGVALFKWPRFEWMLEKLAEIGVDALTPLAAERSVVKLSAEQWKAKEARLEKIILEARRQSLSGREFELREPQKMDDYLNQQKNTQIIFAQPGNYQNLINLKLHCDEITLLSGPEGGFSPAEMARIEAAGGQPVSLGDNILRAETAPLVIASVLRMREYSE